MASILSEEDLDNMTVEELNKVCDIMDLPSGINDKASLKQSIVQHQNTQVEQYELCFGPKWSEDNAANPMSVYEQEAHIAKQFRPDRQLGKTIRQEDILRQQAERPTESFQYKTLENDSTIRLVILLPGKETDGIECITMHTSIDNPLGYLALSYTWGDPAVTLPIVLDGHEFQVTENLESALRHLRSPDFAVGYWIDAICINQKDIAERNSQVQLMKDIYEKSNGVMAWLGPEAEDSNLALEKMMEIQRYFEESRDTIDNIITRSLLGGRGLDEPWNAEPWGALYLLFRRDWWCRVWVAQEASTVMASGRLETRICCGKSYASWKAVMFTVNLITTMVSKPGFEWFGKMGVAAASRLDILKKSRQNGGQEAKLLGVLKFLRPLNATDQRDKVYAGLGLATDVSRGGLRIDYNLSVQQVYSDVAEYCLVKGKNLDWLGHCDDSPRMPELPSWVPDWSSFEFSSDPFPTRMPGTDGNMRPVYSASGHVLDSSSGNLMNQELGTIQEKRLMLKGFRIDIIKSLQQPSLTAEHDVSAKMHDTTIEKSWAPTNPTDQYEPTGETMEQAYLRTIVADAKTKGNEVISRGHAMDWSALDSPAGDDWMSLLSNVIEHLGPLKFFTTGRNYATSERGFMGLVPHRCQVGDSVCILLGGQVPYVLREVGDSYAFVGECYIHGLMDGEAMRLLGKGEFRLETIVLE